MFTNKEAKYYGDNKVLLDSACLSTDTKPTTGVANGSKCIEMDTGKTYMFNEEDSEWEELPSSGGGGGGGSSDFSTAEVTFINNTVDAISISCCVTKESPIPLIPATSESEIDLDPDTSEVVTVILYKGHARAGVMDDVTLSASGNADASTSPGIVTITGDCTITIS